MRNFKQLYMTLLPIPAVYSTLMGIDTGINANKRKLDHPNPLEVYSNVIGYTGLGILTGITYPISYPLFGLFLLYQNNKN